ncbi:MAG: hypothetical protein KAR45_04390, partial [Desulfobacteraceae bacterium]|nr:hypothetical protein [Desulfobacteraceae bacterium]
MRRLLQLSIIIVLSILVMCIGKEGAANNLLDDFTGPYISSEKWQNREFVREVTDGKLLSKIGNAGGWGIFNNTTSFQTPHLVNSIQCDIVINTMILDTGNNPKSFVKIEGFFYNTQNSGGATGDVLAEIYIGDRGSGLEAFWDIKEAQDDSLTSWAIINTGSLGLLSPVPFHTVSLNYNDVTNQFTFDVGGVAVFVNGPGYQRPAQTWFKGITAGIEADNGSGTGLVSIEVDNVFVNNVAYDMFDSSPLDRTKWQELEIVREIADHKIRLNVQADSYRSDMALRPGNQATDYLET